MINEVLIHLWNIEEGRKDSKRLACGNGGTT
jgi:hypothetical protein